MINTMFLRCAYTNIPYINRISTVVDSGRAAEKYKMNRNMACD
jgi:hypothetical protein